MLEYPNKAITLPKKSPTLPDFLWKWWNVRNKADRGRGVGETSEQAAGDVLRMVNGMSGREKMPTQRRNADIRWIAPLPGQLKINLDGSFLLDTLQGSWGFVPLSFGTMKVSLF